MPDQSDLENLLRDAGVARLYTTDEYQARVRQLQAERNGTPIPRPEPEDDPNPPSSWATPLSLVAALTRGDVPPPTILGRTDNRHLFYPGKHHALLGESESGKSWVAALVVLDVIQRLELSALWVDYEDDDRTLAHRLHALGATDKELDRVIFLRPEEPLINRSGRHTDGSVALGELLHAVDFAVTVIDGVTEAMTMEGLDMLDNADVASWYHRLPRRIAGHGSAIVTLDHLPKAIEGVNRRFGIGAQHKLAGIDGAAYRLDLRRRLTRAQGIEPVEGVIDITVTKDRPGWVRQGAGEGLAARLNLTAWPDTAITWTLEPPGLDTPIEPDMRTAVAILDHLAIYDGATQTRIETNTPGRHDAVRQALTWLIARGWVTVEHTGQSHRHHLTPEGRTHTTGDDQ